MGTLETRFGRYIGIEMIGAAGVILALAPTFAFVFVAEILHGTASGLLTPAIAAISLGLVGRGAMSKRAGRNYGFDAAGNALTVGAICIRPLSPSVAYGPTGSTMYELATPGLANELPTFSGFRPFLVWAFAYR